MGDLVGMTAVVLAGGLGTRLRSVVRDRPKVLAEVAGRPFLAFLLDQIADAGISRAVLCTGYRAEQIRETFGEVYRGLSLGYSEEPSPLGTGGALRLALPQLESDPVLVFNGDSICEVDLPSLVRYHVMRGAEATVLLAYVDDVRRYGQVTISDGGRVVAFEEKGARHGSGWINAGVYVLGRRVLEGISQGREVSLEREIFPVWIDRGLYGCPCPGRFLDIGTPETYAAAECIQDIVTSPGRATAV